MYLPLHNVSGRKYFVRIPLDKLMLFVVSLPLFAFITCVLITMVKDFEKANGTHCLVPNIFPSISASIGNYYPQITIWETAIYVHAPLRFFIVHLRYKYYKSVVRNDLVVIVNLAVLLNVVENLALLGLTHWTSSLYYRKYTQNFLLQSIPIELCKLLIFFRDSSVRICRLLLHTKL